MARWRRRLLHFGCGSHSVKCPRCQPCLEAASSPLQQSGIL
ncbi:MAG: hypothetical protein E5W89_30935 [Mesorhizobium sp.]|nr:MAG: hypothetical protein E5W89_30935 [Mesorhizobium sp.]